MGRSTTTLLRAALSALHYSHADALIAPFASGDGVILMLHHVVPDAPRPFEPNGILKVTPAFLDSVIRQVRQQGFEIIALDEVAERLRSGRRGKPFAVFTLDDGYRDNRDHALPVFKAHGAPFTVYVPTDYPDGRGDLWWLTLEEALRRLPSVAINMGATRRTFALSTPREKTAAFETIYWWLRSLTERCARGVTKALAAEAGFDPHDLTRSLVMTYDELREFAKDPLVTIGAHTKSHFAVAKLTREQARAEIAGSVARIEAELGRPCRHLSYPYGCEDSAGERDFELARELGLETAVTTRKGMLYGAHKDAMTALPRLSLNGEFQNDRYVKVLLSGAPFLLLDAVRRMTRARINAQSPAV